MNVDVYLIVGQFGLKYLVNQLEKLYWNLHKVIIGYMSMLWKGPHTELFQSCGASHWISALWEGLIQQTSADILNAFTLTLHSVPKWHSQNLLALSFLSSHLSLSLLWAASSLRGWIDPRENVKEG